MSNNTYFTFVIIYFSSLIIGSTSCMIYNSEEVAPFVMVAITIIMGGILIIRHAHYNTSLFKKAFAIYDGFSHSTFLCIKYKGNNYIISEGTYLIQDKNNQIRRIVASYTYVSDVLGVHNASLTIFKDTSTFNLIPLKDIKYIKPCNKNWGRYRKNEYIRYFVF